MMDQQPIDAVLREKLDLIGEILEATYNDQKAAERAIAALKDSRDKFDRELGVLMRSVARSVDSSTSRIATLAASELQKEFVAADQSAIAARRRYESAARYLGWKMFGMALLAGVIIFGGCWAMLMKTIPSLEEINNRKLTVASLERQVDTLEKRGAGLEWTYCPLGDSGDSALCFRTDEKEGWTDKDVVWRGSNGETYRLPW